MLYNTFTNPNLTDMETCYKVSRAELIKGIVIEQHGFGVGPELTAKVAKKHCPIYEVRISYYGTYYGEEKNHMERRNQSL